MKKICFPSPLRTRFAAGLLSVSCACAGMLGAGASALQAADTTPAPAPQAVSQVSPLPAPQAAPRTTSGYVLGPGDRIIVREANVEELVADKILTIDSDGAVNVPSVGRVAVGGLTVEQAEREVSAKLTVLLKNPQPSISVSEYRSQPVSVLGAVNTAGVVQLQGHKTVAEVIAMAGGLRPDAGNNIQITRKIAYGRLPLPNEKLDPTGSYSVASIGAGPMMRARVPAENILVMPEDVISVPRAELVYVIGDIKKPGGFPVTESRLSILQALSLAEGVGNDAAPSRSRILRLKPGTTERTEISVDVKKVLSGQAEDLELFPQDILFIPTSTGKKVSMRILEAAITTGTGIAVWGKY